jgi:hypothetical protein
MGLLEDIKCGKYNLELFIIIIVLFFYLFCKQTNIENMTDTTTTTTAHNTTLSPETIDAINKAVNDKYLADVESIGNLSTIATALQSDEGITIPGNTNFRGNLNVGTITNDNSYISIGMNGNDNNTGTNYHIKNLKDTATDKHSFQVTTNTNGLSTPILTIDNGSSLKIDNGSSLKIDNGWSINTDENNINFMKDGLSTSILTIDNDSSLKIDKGSSLKIDNGSSLKIDNGWSINTDENKINFMNDGVVQFEINKYTTTTDPHVLSSTGLKEKIDTNANDIRGKSVKGHIHEISYLKYDDGKKKNKDQKTWTISDNNR